MTEPRYQYTLGRGGSGVGLSFRFQQLKCPTKAKLDLESIASGRKGSMDNDDTLAGTLLHAFMEMWDQIGVEFDPMHVEFLNTYGDSMCTPWRTPLHAEKAYRQALDVFIAYRMLNNNSLTHLGKTIASEYKVGGNSAGLMPLLHGVKYSGAIDRLVEREDGVYVLDFKFPNTLDSYEVEVANDYWKEKMYILAALGDGIPVKGGIIHATQRKRPVRTIEIKIDLPNSYEIEVLSNYFKVVKALETNQDLNQALFLHSCYRCYYHNAGCIQTKVS